MTSSHTIQSVSTLLHTGTSDTSGSLGVECFQPSLFTYASTTSALVSLVLSRFLSSYVMGHIQMLDSSYVLLKKGSLASEMRHVEGCFSLVHQGKRSSQGSFTSLDAKDSAITVFNPWLIKDVLCQQSFSLVVLHSGKSNSIVYNKSLLAVLEIWASWCA